MSKVGIFYFDGNCGLGENAPDPLFCRISQYLSILGITPKSYLITSIGSFISTKNAAFRGYETSSNSSMLINCGALQLRGAATQLRARLNDWQTEENSTNIFDFSIDSQRIPKYLRYSFLPLLYSMLDDLYSMLGDFGGPSRAA